jgi:hypothetical protein
MLITGCRLDSAGTGTSPCEYGYGPLVSIKCVISTFTELQIYSQGLRVYNSCYYSGYDIFFSKIKKILILYHPDKDTCFVNIHSL